MEKEMKIRFKVRDFWLEIWDEDKNDSLVNMKISGVDRDKLADVVADLLRTHFFVWCP